MKTLGMTLQDTLTPVTKVQFNKWHSENAIRLIGAGHSNVDILLSKLNNITADWNINTIDLGISRLSKHDHIYMFSNGCDEFLLVINDMQASEDRRTYLKNTDKKHVIVYLVS